MTRWFLGSVSLVFTLLAGGCTNARLARNDIPTSTSPPIPASPAHATMKTPQHPDTLPPSTDALQKSPAKDPKDKDAKFAEFTRPPEPLESQLTALQQMPKHPIVEPSPLIETTPKHPIVRALECMLDNRPQEAQQQLGVYDTRTQELLLRLLPSLSLVAKNNNLSAADIAVLSEQMAGFNRILQQNAEFSLPKMCFCELDSIQGYAIYKPLPAEAEFVAGQYVQLYVELKNFTSRPRDGGFETKFASKVEIRDDKGKEIWKWRFPSDKLTLVSRTRLTEYYHKYGIPFPSNLPPGDHTLIVEMVDETIAGAPARTARGSLLLRIVANKN